MSIVGKASICCNCFVYMFVVFIVQVKLLLILHEPEEIFDEFGDLEPIASLQIL